MSESTSATQIRVGVIDSGWDTRLSDHRVEEGIGLLARTGDFSLEHSPDTNDLNGHGTVCSDIVLQFAPRASIVPIRVFNRRLETSPEILVAAIEWACARGIRLLNLSLSTKRRDAIPMLYRACETARRAGSIIVCAAGGISGDVGYPAAFEPVISVLAGPIQTRSIVYRPGSAVECIGPGSHCARGLGGRRVSVNATSFAVPVVTGIIANILSLQPAAPLEMVREALRNPPSDEILACARLEKRSTRHDTMAAGDVASTIQRTNRGQSQWRRS